MRGRKCDGENKKNGKKGRKETERKIEKKTRK